ncbi:caskin-2-like isoform X1 [Argonauta hians]
MGKDQDLTNAIKNQDISTIQKILAKAVKPVKNNGNKMRTLERKSLELINSKAKFNVNYQDADGVSYLHHAALMGNTEVLNLLLQTSIDITLKDNKGMVPLHYAAWQGKVEPVRILLEQGSPVDEKADDGGTALHLASQHGHYDVVNMLLVQHADPRIVNNSHRTPMDLACEFGRFRVVELLVKSSQCQELLKDQADDMVDNEHTTCLHLAARNGHTDIVKLLIQNGVNINRCTLQGTCLHAAALFGKIDVVRLLLECGADVNQSNSYDQTALDIVNRFTTVRAAKELKALLKEASFAVKARAIKEHSNQYDIHGLAFKEGEYIKVLEQKADGIWKGCVIHNDRMSKAGYFPADHVVLVDTQTHSSLSHQSSQNHINTKTPPLVPGTGIQVPDLLNRNSLTYGTTKRTTSDGSGSDDTYPFPPPPSPCTMTSNNQSHDNVFIDTNHISPPSSTGNVPCQPIQARVIVNNQPVSDHVGDWPNLQHNHFNGDIRTTTKDSPINSNRNSSTSTDSGRGVSTVQLDTTVPLKNHHNFVNIQIKAQHRLSGQSYESGVSSRQSYHSTSSSSVASLDQLEEGRYSSQANVADLFKTGLSDSEILLTWLRDLRFEGYYDNFVSAGYDMPTISRMTPEDLTAIGITKPSHRKRLKADISRMNIYDGIPDYKPNDLLQWLKLLNLDYYHDTLLSQGYTTIDQVTEITWEDLEEIGIKLLGHQKKIILAIDRLKRIMAGTKRLSSLEQRSPYIEPLEPPVMNMSGQWSLDAGSNTSSEAALTMTRPKKSTSGESLTEMHPFHPYREKDNSSGDHTPTSSSPGNLPPDYVAIQVKRSLSNNSSSDMSPIVESTDMTGQPISYQSFHIPSSNKRCSDVIEEKFPGTNGQLIIEDTLSDNVTRPSATVSPRVMVKPKPIAKIPAKTKQHGREMSPDLLDEKHSRELAVEALKSFNAMKSCSQSHEHIYDQPGVNLPKSPKPLVLPKSVSLNNNTSISTGCEPLSPMKPEAEDHYPPIATKPKKVPPPPPPKRSNSMRVEGPKYNLPNRRSEPATPICMTDSLSKSLPNSTTHHEEFANCVKTLSERFGKNMGNADAQDSSSNESDDMPPPPPPLAMDIITPRLHNYGIPSKGGRSTMDLSSNNPPSRLKKDSCPILKEKPAFLMQKFPINEKIIEDPPAPMAQPTATLDKSIPEQEEFVAKRKDSTLSMDSNCSSSSVESNTLPFANENIGTIKQKNSPAALKLIEGLQAIDHHTIDVQSTNTSQPTSSAEKLPPKPRDDDKDEPPQRPPLPKKYEASASPIIAPKPKLRPTPPPVEPKKFLETPPKPKPVATETGNVLHDIDNMLQNLTEELDAMLEQN